MRFGNINFRQSVIDIVRSREKEAFAPARDKDPGHQGNLPRRSLGLALRNQGSALRKMLFKNSAKVTPDTSGAAPRRDNGSNSGSGPLQPVGLRPPALPPRPLPPPLPARPAVSKHGLAVGGIRVHTLAEEKIKNGLTHLP